MWLQKRLFVVLVVLCTARCFETELHENAVAIKSVKTSDGRAAFDSENETCSEDLQSSWLTNAASKSGSYQSSSQAESNFESINSELSSSNANFESMTSTSSQAESNFESTNSEFSSSNANFESMTSTSSQAESNFESLNSEFSSSNTNFESMTRSESLSEFESSHSNYEATNFEMNSSSQNSDYASEIQHEDYSIFTSKAESSQSMFETKNEESHFDSLSPYSSGLDIPLSDSKLGSDQLKKGTSILKSPQWLDQQHKKPPLHELYYPNNKLNMFDFTLDDCDVTSSELSESPTEWPHPESLDHDLGDLITRSSSLYPSHPHSEPNLLGSFDDKLFKECKSGEFTVEKPIDHSESLSDNSERLEDQLLENLSDSETDDHQNNDTMAEHLDSTFSNNPTEEYKHDITPSTTVFDTEKESLNLDNTENTPSSHLDAIRPSFETVSSIGSPPLSMPPLESLNNPAALLEETDGSILSVGQPENSSFGSVVEPTPCYDESSQESSLCSPEYPIEPFPFHTECPEEPLPWYSDFPKEPSTCHHESSEESSSCQSHSTEEPTSCQPVYPTEPFSYHLEYPEEPFFSPSECPEELMPCSPQYPIEPFPCHYECPEEPLSGFPESAEESQPCQPECLEKSSSNESNSSEEQTSCYSKFPTEPLLSQHGSPEDQPLCHPNHPEVLVSPDSDSLGEPSTCQSDCQEKLSPCHCQPGSTIQPLPSLPLSPDEWLPCHCQSGTPAELSPSQPAFSEKPLESTSIASESVLSENQSIGTTIPQTSTPYNLPDLDKSYPYNRNNSPYANAPPLYGRSSPNEQLVYAQEMPYHYRNSRYPNYPNSSPPESFHSPYGSPYMSPYGPPHIPPTHSPYGHAGYPKHPPRGYPHHGYPPHGYPPHEYPPHGYPPHGYPPHGYPPHGYPPHGYPPHGYTPNGYTPNGYPSYEYLFNAFPYEYSFGVSPHKSYNPQRKSPYSQPKSYRNPFYNQDVPPYQMSLQPSSNNQLGFDDEPITSKKLPYDRYGYEETQGALSEYQFADKPTTLGSQSNQFPYHKETLSHEAPHVFPHLPEELPIESVNYPSEYPALSESENRTPATELLRSPECSPTADCLPLEESPHNLESFNQHFPTLTNPIDQSIVTSNEFPFHPRPQQEEMYTKGASFPSQYSNVNEFLPGHDDTPALSTLDFAPGSELVEPKSMYPLSMKPGRTYLPQESTGIGPLLSSTFPSENSPCTDQYYADDDFVCPQTEPSLPHELVHPYYPENLLEPMINYNPENEMESSAARKFPETEDYLRKPSFMNPHNDETNSLHPQGELPLPCEISYPSDNLPTPPLMPEADSLLPESDLSTKSVPTLPSKLPSFNSEIISSLSDSAVTPADLPSSIDSSFQSSPSHAETASSPDSHLSTLVDLHSSLPETLENSSPMEIISLPETNLETPVHLSSLSPKDSSLPHPIDSLSPSPMETADLLPAHSIPSPTPLSKPNPANLGTSHKKGVPVMDAVPKYVLNDLEQMFEEAKTKYLSSYSEYPQNIGEIIDTLDESSLTYQVVIVGSGAGALSALQGFVDANKSVLIIEKGYLPPQKCVSMYHRSGLLNTDYVTRYQASIPGCNAKKVLFAPNVVGGTTSYDLGTWDHGALEKYRSWGQKCKKWSWENVAKHYQSIETIQRTERSTHEREEISPNGSIVITRHTTETATTKSVMRAFKEVGIRESSYDLEGARESPGMTVVPMIHQTQDNSLYAQKMFAQIKTKDNLHIALDTQATRIIFENDRAVGVSVVTPSGSIRTIFVEEELILGGGPVSTVKLLYQSGVGDESALQQLQIPVQCHTPHLGLDLMVYPMYVGLCMKFPPGSLISESESDFAAIGSMFGETDLPAGLAMSYVKAFLQVYDAPQPNVQINLHAFSKRMPSRMKSFMSGLFQFDENTQEVVYRLSEQHDLLFVVPQLLDTESKGAIKISSADYHAQPVIDTGMYNCERDLTIMEKTIGIIKRLSKTKTFKGISGELVQLPVRHCEGAPFTKAFNECSIRHLSVPGLHPTGGAIMGNDEMTSVVNEELIVHGVKNVRCFNAAVLPKGVAADSSAASSMIGKYGAALALGD